MFTATKSSQYHDLFDVTSEIVAFRYSGTDKNAKQFSKIRTAMTACIVGDPLISKCFRKRNWNAAIISNPKSIGTNCT